MAEGVGDTTLFKPARSAVSLIILNIITRERDFPILFKKRISSNPLAFFHSVAIFFK